MGTIHIAGAYTDDDGSTRTFSGDLDMSPADPGAGQTMPDPNPAAGGDNGDQQQGDQQQGGDPGAPEATDPGQPIPDAPAYPPTDTPTTTGDPAQAPTTNPPPDPNTGTTGGDGEQAGGADPTPAGAEPATPAADTGGGAGGGPDFPGELRRDDNQHTPDDNVRTLQQQLTTRGIDTGPVDGFYGPRTESAIRQLQQQAGIGNTGTVDEQTWSAAWA